MEYNGYYPIYVTVGFVLNGRPIITKQRVMVNERDDETPVHAANRLRMSLVSQPQEKDLLYFEIYVNEKATSPYAASTNAPSVTKEKYHG